MNFLESLFSSSDFMPHGYCYLWNTGLVWLHFISDVLIALAYFSIPITLLYFIRKRRDLPFNWMFLCFGIFILACGTTHIMEVWTLWNPTYWLSGLIKAVTALASVPTAVLLVQLVPRALALPSPEALKAEIADRKRAEDALRESEDRYRDLVEHSTDLICTHNLQGRLLSVNELPVKLLGYTREELLNKPMRDFLLPEARAQFDESLINIQKDGFVKGSMVVLTKTGERRVWEYHNTLRTEGVTEPIVRGIAHDVTERKRAEKALRESEERFRAILNRSPNLIFLKDVEGRYLLINRQHEDTFHISQEQICGKTDAEIFPPVQAAQFRASDLRVLQAGSPMEFEEVALHDDGPHTSIVQKFPLFNAGGKIYAIAGILTDITERKRAEEARRISEELFRAAFAETAVGFAITDLTGRFVKVNQAYCRITGYSEEELCATDFQSITYPEDLPANLEQRCRLAAGEVGSIVCQKRYVKKSGELVWVQNSVSRILDESGGTSSFLALTEDITERKRAEDSLRQLSGRLLQLQDEERRKIAEDLHDSTGQDLVALATTLGQLYAALPSSSRKLRKLVSQCKGLADQCTRQVRTFSYLLHPPMLEEAGLEDAIRHYVHGYTQRTGILVTLEVSPQFGRIPRDVELALFRVVQESLTNIQRHSGSPHATLRMHRWPQELSLEVSDEGHGIPGSQPGKPVTFPLGTGVGIPSMHERVKQIRGFLEIASSTSGTTIRLTVPAHD